MRSRPSPLPATEAPAARAPGAGAFDFLFYLTVTIGMAIACSNQAMLSELHALAPGAWIAVAAAGALCCVVALIIGEPASMFPGAPGVRAYVRAAFGDALSLGATFLLLALVVLFSSVESYFFVNAAARVTPGVPFDALAVGAILVVTAVNLLGAELPRTVQVVCTVLLLALLGGIMVSSLAMSPAAVPATAAPAAAHALSLGALAAAIGTSVFLFTGFEWTTVLGRSPAAYRRAIPLAMPLGIAVLAVVFAGLAAGLERHFPGLTHLGFVPHVDLGRALYGRPGELAMAAVSFLSIITTFNAGFLGASRLLYGVAREGRFHPWAARIHLGTGVPVGAVLMIGGACALCTFVVLRTGAHQVVALACAAMYCCIYAVMVLSTARLRVRRAAAPRPYRSPIPVGLQRGVGGALLVLAAGIVVGSEESPVATGALFLGCAALSLAAGWWQARRPAGRPKLASPVGALAARDHDKETSHHVSAG
jgi:APA family basic amino acid/polyamine antiporter